MTKTEESLYQTIEAVSKHHKKVNLDKIRLISKLKGNSCDDCRRNPFCYIVKKDRGTKLDLGELIRLKSIVIGMASNVISEDRSVCIFYQESK